MRPTPTQNPDLFRFDPADLDEAAADQSWRALDAGVHYPAQMPAGWIPHLLREQARRYDRTAKILRSPTGYLFKFRWIKRR